MTSYPTLTHVPMTRIGGDRRAWCYAQDVLLWSRGLFIITLFFILFATTSRATLTVVLGNCLSDPNQWPFRIESSTDNDKAVSLLRQRDLPYAGLGGYVTGGEVYWNDGSVAHWRPPAVAVPPRAAGFLVVRADASWSYVTYDNYANSLFICESNNSTDGGNVTSPPTTQAPDGPPVPPHQTTVAPSRPAVVDVIRDVKKSLDAMGDIHVSAFTANAIKIQTSIETLTRLIALHEGEGAVYIGFGGCAAGDAYAVAALTANITADAMYVHVPFDVLNTTTSLLHQLCVLGLERGAQDTPIHELTSSTLHVHALVDLLHGLNATIAVLEEETAYTQQLIKSIALFGEGTAVPYTTEVASTYGLLEVPLFLVPANDGHCECRRSSIALPFFVVGRYLHVELSTQHLTNVQQGTCVCASIHNTNTVVATIVRESLQAVANLPTYLYGVTMEVTVHGVTSTSLATRHYTAGLASSVDCNRYLPDDVLVEVSHDRPSAPLVYVTTPALGADAPPRYVCLTSKTTASAVPISFDGVPVTVAGAVDSGHRGTLTIFSDMKGRIYLSSYRRPTTSTNDALVRQFLENCDEGCEVRFVPLATAAHAGVEEKLSVCAEAYDVGGRAPLKNGHLLLPVSSLVPLGGGILCVEDMYLGIDYHAADPRAWLLTMAGRDSFSDAKFVLSKFIQDATTITYAGPDTSDLALRFAMTDSCSDGFTFPIRSTGSLSKVVALPDVWEELGLTVCVGVADSLGDTYAFASAGFTVTLLPYSTAQFSWQVSVGIHMKGWLPCGASTLCGVATKPRYSEVCNHRGAGRASYWPDRLADDLGRLDAFRIMLGDDNGLVDAGFFHGAIIVRSASLSLDESFHCWVPERIAMSSSSGVYGTTAVVTIGRPQILFPLHARLSGIVIALMPWGADCAVEHPAQLHVIISRGSSGKDTIDVSPLTRDRARGYYRLCYYAEKQRIPFGDSIVRVEDLTGAAAQADAVVFDDSSSMQNTHFVWETQQLSWYVVGTFFPDVALTLKLVWNDPTCAASPAYSASMAYVSPVVMSVEIDIFRTAAPPMILDQSYLYTCYSTSCGDRGTNPLPVEQRRQRRIQILPLTLTSLDSRPYGSVSLSSNASISVQLSGPDLPPLTYLAVFPSSLPPSGMQAPNVCFSSGGDASLNTVMPVVKDSRGARWAVVTDDLVRAVTLPPGWMYWTVCATASHTVDRRFFAPVDVYFIVNEDGVDANPVALCIRFKPVTGSSVLSLRAATEALVAYATEAAHISANQLWVGERESTNTFAIYVRPLAKGGAVAAANATAAIYSALSQGLGLPFIVSGFSGSGDFVATTVEGVYLSSWIGCDMYPSADLIVPLAARNTSTALRTAVSVLFCALISAFLIIVTFVLRPRIPYVIHDRRVSEGFAEVAQPVTVECDSPLPGNPVK